MTDPVIPHWLPDHACAAHGFFTRKGGVSAGLYDSLNVGLGTGDDPANVTENRARVRDRLGGTHLVTLHQQHTGDCLYVDAPFASEGDRPVGDALVTDVAGLTIGVLTADCAPILYYGERRDGSPLIGAAHAGWGGALKGIQIATAEAMVARGALIESLHICIGPCIAQASYEVSEAFSAPFLEQSEDYEIFFKAGRAGHLHFDLAGYNAARLAQTGIRHIVISGEDTYTDEGRFFSYRRATHRKEADYGRQISAIVIRP